MAKNNHSDSDNLTKLDALLRRRHAAPGASARARALAYAESIAAIENCIAVVSDFAVNSSRIIAGKFAATLGLDDYRGENSIWEKRILALMTPEECQEKVITELRFYNFLKKIAPARREDFSLVSRLRFATPDGAIIDVRHRMHYVYDSSGHDILAAICLYSPLLPADNTRSYAVDNVTGVCEELTDAADGSVLSPRQCQVLALIASGKKSSEIAALLHISIHTVSRHRQSILAALNVRNSHQACLIAKSMGLI